jgi:hypothetical protein
MKDLFAWYRPQASAVGLRPIDSVMSGAETAKHDTAKQDTEQNGPTKQQAPIELPSQPHDPNDPLASERPRADSNTSSASEPIPKDAQPGVQKISATTLVWSKQHLFYAYLMIWLIAFTSALEQGMAFSLTPYVTSSFHAHSLTPATSVVSSLIGGLTKLPLAKFIDIVGRPAGYFATVASLTLGLVLMAACHGVEMFAAAQVFYWVGHNGTEYVISVFVADTSRLRNRGLMFAVLSSPFVVTSWASGPLAEAFLGLKGVEGWRWGESLV